MKGTLAFGRFGHTSRPPGIRPPPHMGWGANPKHRVELLGGARKEGRNLKPTAKTVFVCDGNATLRNFAGVASKVPRTATFIAKILLNTLPKPSAWAHALLVVMDDSTRMMPERAELHRKRYRNAPEPSTEATAEVAKAGNHHIRQPVRFPLLFQTPVGKAHAYRLLSQAIYVELIGSYRARGLSGFSISFPDGTVRSHGDGPKVPGEVKLWGEADLKCFVAASSAHRQGWSPTVLTIDTDMILQSVCWWKPGRPDRLCLKGETINVPTLLADLGGDDPSLRMSAGLMLICGFGCDYSEPLSRNGYRKLTVAKLAWRMRRKSLQPITYHDTLPCLLVGRTTFYRFSDTVAISRHHLLHRRTAELPWQCTVFKAGATKTYLLKKEPTACPDARGVYVFSPTTMWRALGHATRVKTKNGGREELLRSVIKSVWATLYFSGVTAQADTFAGPLTLKLPAAAYLAALAKAKLGFVVHCDSRYRD